MDSYINLRGHADTLIPHTPGRGDGVGVALLQLQQQVGGRRLVRRGGMGALTTDGRSTVNDRIRLQETTRGVRCARPLSPAVTHYSVVNCD